MAAEEFKRRLTAILSADVEGYSRLMREDEETTIRTLKAFRAAIRDQVQKYRGRVVDSPGDNILAEFASVLDAVNCAVEIQRELAERNTELPENRRMQFRIGVNLGDIVEDGERIYGDGVNIAARMESLAEGGGICISGKVYEEVKHKLGLEYEYQGEQEVKNIPEPVRVYKVLSFPGAAAHRVIKAKKAAGTKFRYAILATLAVLVVGAAVAAWYFYFRVPPIKPASVERMAQPLPDKPSIAVLPFENMSGDPEQEYFADGLTEEIITALSKVPRLFVIARNSSFTYKGKPVKVQQVSEDLGVQYVLEGSVRMAEKRVRVTAQLVDALNGSHLWAEKYDRDLKDIFALQDEITLKVVASLQVKLTEGEQALIVAGGTKNFEAYVKFLQGIEYEKRSNREGNLLARKMAEEAIALDPSYPRGYRLLATTHWVDYSLGISTSPRESLAKAAQLYQKVIAMDPSEATAHAFLGFVYTLMRQYEKGIAEAKKAVTLNPNAADAQLFFGQILHFNGRHKEAIEAITKAIRLNPFPPNWYFLILGFAYRHAGRYEEAIVVLKKALRGSPDNLFAHRALATTYALMGRKEEARAEVEEILRINPKFSIQQFAKTVPYKNPADRELVINAFRKAGLPETPPLPLPDKPSIAVLPFVNMSGDPAQEYFSDGMSEEIITALSKVPKLFVIARNSTFTYKGKAVKVQRVARELGVRYVLEGSVRKVEDKVRITAQLVDATTGNHLWAERYDRDLKDIFAVQDEITMRIITALQVKLTEGEQARISGKATDNLEAYLKELQAREHFFRMNKQGSMRARELAREATELDPEYAAPHTMLALTHMMDLWFRFTDSPEESMKLAVEAAEKALAIDDTDPSTYVGLCMLYIMQRRHEEAITAAERAIELSPSGAGAHNALGTALSFAGRHEDAIVFYKKAISLNPFPPTIYFRGLGNAYRMAGQYQEAITEYKKTLQQNPDDLFAHLGLAVAYVSLGRQEAARAEAAEVLRIHPRFSVEHHSNTLPFKYKTDTELYIDALRKAGLM